MKVVVVVLQLPKIILCRIQAPPLSKGRWFAWKSKPEGMLRAVLKFKVQTDHG